MVYSAQNFWVSGLCPSSGTLNTWKHVSETGPVSVLRWGGRRLLSWVQWLRLALYTGQLSPPSLVSANRFSFWKFLFFLVFRIPDDGQSPETHTFWGKLQLHAHMYVYVYTGTCARAHTHTCVHAAVWQINQEVHKPQTTVSGYTVYAYQDEELLWRKSSGSGLESQEHGRRDPSHWPL
jgi:hypothetical protein